jgi:adenylate cyclase
LKLKNKKILYPLLSIHFVIVTITILRITLLKVSFNTFDYKILDNFYRKALENNKGPKLSDRIAYVNISEESYDVFNSSVLDREYIAKLNDIFSQIGPQAVMYDIIFPRASTQKADSILAESLNNAGMIYLPAGFQLSDKPEKFEWKENEFYKKLSQEYLKKPNEYGNGNPLCAKWAVVQYSIFAKNSFNSGHITATADDDGVFRHYPMIIKIDSLFFPTVTLAIFLDYNKIPFDSIKIYWGEKIIIPAVKDGFLEKDFIIPIDDKGKAFIPYPCKWDRSPKMIEMQNLIEKAKDQNNLDDLLNYFEGNFIFVGDVSTGIADLGQTVLEKDVPLVAAHAALMNAFITDSFYDSLSNFKLISIIFLISLLFAFSLIPKSSVYFYISVLFSIIFIITFTYFQITSYVLVPVFTLLSSIILIGMISLLVLQITTGRQEAFIKNAFSKYVPKKVVDELLNKPELLQLGGEERTISILFSDIVEFTTISERLKPKVLVPLLNEYLTEMTNIVLEQGGIIDKYIGDAILAEFGAPIPFEKHADAAVNTALLMQKKLLELNNNWQKKALPLINCRIGINSGNVILGNMGSNQVFDYTVIGDNVNLASRLEGANKKYNSSIMISEFTLDNLTKEKFRIRSLDVIKVKGKSKAVKVYEVYGSKDDEISENSIQYFETYNEAFNHYLNKEFTIAKNLFNRCLMIKINDPASLEMLNRIETIMIQTLPENWDGSITLKEK